MSRLIALLVAGCALLSGETGVSNRAPLQKNAYHMLPLGTVRPEGWLRRQLEIQAGGLSGHLDEFWPSLGPDSNWLGGAGEAWERGPYYTDGLVPLAFLLDDPKLIAKAKRWVGWTLDNQRADGQIGPPKNSDWWPRMVMLKALTQYQEATGDPRVIPVMEKYFRYQAGQLERIPMRSWAIYRWQDELLSILWLYNRNGDPSLLNLAQALRARGHDWGGQFAKFLFTNKVARSETSLSTHVVNNAMGLKTPAMWWLVSGNDADRKAVYRQLEQLDRYHLLPNGVHAGDEHYAGLNPTQGTELCAVLEAMFSLENMMAILGDPALGDRLEKIAFNPLPATFSGDMWAHQYDQQPNQVLCSRHPRQWTTNGPESNLFGLEPNFGCCTANMHQSWPKFAANLWMATPDEGLAAVAYAPSRVTARVRGGVRVVITEQTEYPFREKIRFTVEPDKPATFPLELRIPGWAANATLSINGVAAGALKPGSFHRIERAWSKGDVVDLMLPMALRVSRWYRESAAIERGPLVLSLKIGEDWRKLGERGKTYEWEQAPVKPRKPQPERNYPPSVADWEVHPTSPWNYALLVDEKQPGRSLRVVEHPVGLFPFTADGAPLQVHARGRRLPQWTLENGSAGPLPQSPVESDQPLEPVVLIPYGSAKLRITAFPLLVR